MNSHTNKSFRDGEKMTEKNFDSTGAMASARFGTPGTEKAVEAVFDNKKKYEIKYLLVVSIKRLNTDLSFLTQNTQYSPNVPDYVYRNFILRMALMFNFQIGEKFQLHCYLKAFMITDKHTDDYTVPNSEIGLKEITANGLHAMDPLAGILEDIRNACKSNDNNVQEIMNFKTTSHKEKEMTQQNNRISISKTLIDEFYKKYNTECNAEYHRKAAAMHSGIRYSIRYLRLGQAFHQEFKLEKITSSEAKMFCDMLYEADGDQAKALISQITDYNN